MPCLGCFLLLHITLFPELDISDSVHSGIHLQHFHTEIIPISEVCSQRIHLQQFNIPVMSLACNLLKPYMWKNKQSCPDGCLCSRTGKPRDCFGSRDSKGNIRSDQQSKKSPQSVRKMKSHWSIF